MVVFSALWSTMLAFSWLYLFCCSKQGCCLVDDSCCSYILSAYHQASGLFLPFSFLLWLPACLLEVKPRYSSVCLFVVVSFVLRSAMLASSWLYRFWWSNQSCCLVGDPCCGNILSGCHESKWLPFYWPLTSSMLHWPILASFFCRALLRGNVGECHLNLPLV